MPAFSIDTYADATLGICNIQNPTYDEANDDNNPHPSLYNRVYFGWVPDTTTGIAKNSDGTDIDPYDNGTQNMHNTPLYWRVLNTTANDTDKTPALFMLTEYALANKIPWDQRSDGYKQRWEFEDADDSNKLKTDSSLREFLQGSSCRAQYAGGTAYEGSGLYDECFDQAEKNVMLATYNEEKTDWYTKSPHPDPNDNIWWVYNTSNDSEHWDAYGCGLNGDKIFLLSAKEVTNKDYGFESMESVSDSKYEINNLKLRSRDTNRCTKKAASTGESSAWWLRSAYSCADGYVARLSFLGNSDCNYSNDIHNTVRFALNIPLSSILLATDSDSAVPTPSSTFISINPSDLDATRGTDPTSGNGAKLTILDDTTSRRLFWIPQGRWVATRAAGVDTSITLPYRRAATGEGEYISAIIKDPKKEHQYYARLKAIPNKSDTNGKVTLSIPSELPQGDYTLIMMSEKDNGYRKTNYAKNYNLRLIVDGSNIIITGNGATGACSIMNPKYDPECSEYNRVYFGWVNNNNNEMYNSGGIDIRNTPLYWRVLNTTANDTLNTPALFMLTEYTLPNYRIFNKSGVDSQIWANSSIKSFLQDDSVGNVYYDCFSTAEKDTILVTYNDENTNWESSGISLDDDIWWAYNDLKQYTAYGCGLSGEKIFLLSAKEVTNENYGFKDSDIHYATTNDVYNRRSNDTNRCTKPAVSTENNCHWWLRSAYSNGSDIVTRIHASGISGSNITEGTDSTVRFALNIPLSKVILASDASSKGTDPSPIFNSIPSLQRTKFLYSVSDYAAPVVITPEGSVKSFDISPDKSIDCAPGAKLTLEVPSRTSEFTLAQSDIYTNAGDTISLHYTGAVTQSDEENAESTETGRTDVVGYISALIKDSDNNGLYHARLKAVGNSSIGNVTMTIPQDLPSGDYTLIVYNERERGEYRTNYAGYAIVCLHIVARPGTDLNRDYNKALGVCNIKNPLYNENGSTYNRVYFGCVPNENTGVLKKSYTDETTTNEVYESAYLGKPIYWRVLNTTANDDAKTPALFMLTEYFTSPGMNWNNNGNLKNLWTKEPDPDDNGATTDCSIKIFLQGLNNNNVYNGNVYYNSEEDKTPHGSVYTDCFDTYEQSAILATTKTEKGNDVFCLSDMFAYPCNLNKEKLFLLSAKEVLNNAYGFGGPEGNYHLHTNAGGKIDPNKKLARLSMANTNTRQHWWLRSTCSNINTSVACIRYTGFSSNAGINTTCYTSFALNIPLSSILLATDSDLAVPSPSSTFTSISPSDLSNTRGTNPSSGYGAKLTIVDDTSARRLFWIPQGKYSWPLTSGGTSITLPYRRAATGEGEYISAIIKDPKEEHQYYARLKAVLNKADANGTVTLCIPAELPQGDYTLIMMSEKDNGYRKTNYAKNYNLRLTVDENKVTITGNGATGACPIMNPKFYDENTPSEYNRVYFGRVPKDNYKTEIYNTYSIYLSAALNEPIYWRVLNTTANDTVGTPALFMLNEYILTDRQNWDNKSPYGQTYQNDCTLRVLLNGPDTGNLYENCFDLKEQNVIMDTYNGEISQSSLNTKPNDQLLWQATPVDRDVTEDDGGSTHRAYGRGLTGDKIFLLSAKEVVNNNYGFANNRTLTGRTVGSVYPADVNRSIHVIGDKGANSWLLRSTNSGSSTGVPAVTSSGGSLYANLSASRIYFRFALNIPLSKVIFAQDTEINPTISSTFSPIVPLTRTTITYPADDYATVSTVEDSPTTTTMDLASKRGAGSKLTIVDDSRDFSITQDLIRGKSGSTITLSYSDASVGDNEYISAIIKDTYGNALYHSRLQPVGNNTNGTVSMTIPNELNHGEYTLVVYNEVERGECNTNYAGYDTVVLVVKDDDKKPVVTNVYRNADGTRFKLTASDNWDLFQVTSPNGIKLRDLANTNVTTNMECGYQTAISIHDLAGNTTTVNEQDMLVDQTPPSVTVNYANGKYVLTVSDNESGVWKITNRDGTVVYRDFS